MFLPPLRRTFVCPGKEIEHCTDGAHMATDVQFAPMRIGPLLLLRSRHANPQQVRIRFVDSTDDATVVLIREHRLGRRIITTIDVRIHLSRFLRISSAPFPSFHKTYIGLCFLSRCISNSNKSQPAIRSFGRDFAFTHPSLHYPRPVRNQVVALHQRLGKQLVFLAVLKRMSIDGIKSASSWG